MERKSITKKSLENYESFLRQEEKSQATVEKYLREIRVLSVGRKNFKAKDSGVPGTADRDISA